MNGVSNYYSCLFEFISLDGSRSAFGDSGIKDKDRKSYYKYHRIVPQGKQIRRVETLLNKYEGRLISFKWIGDDEEVLLSVDLIDNSKYRSYPDNVVTSLTLNHN